MLLRRENKFENMNHLLNTTTNGGSPYFSLMDGFGNEFTTHLSLMILGGSFPWLVNGVFTSFILNKMKSCQ